MNRLAIRFGIVAALLVPSPIASVALADLPWTFEVEATTPSPAVVRHGSTSGVELRWILRYAASGGGVRVATRIRDSSGTEVRLLRTRHEKTRSVFERSTHWDLKDDSGAPVPPGLYYYRVVVTDEAGNTAQSGESRPLQIKIN